MIDKWTAVLFSVIKWKFLAKYKYQKNITYFQNFKNAHDALKDKYGFLSDLRHLCGACKYSKEHNVCFLTKSGECFACIYQYDVYESNPTKKNAKAVLDRIYKMGDKFLEVEP